MAAPGLTEAPALRVRLGGHGPVPAGFLDAGEHADADVPLAPGDDLPFEDNAVAELEASAAALGPTLATRFPRLVECRRVLAPGGRFHLDVATAASSAGDWREWTRLAGFVNDPAPGRALALTKRDRSLAGTPLVSILIASYNPRFFEAALDSALTQTWENLEIVICDDARDDAIEAIVRRRPTRRAVRYERNPERLRARANYLHCVARAEGEFVKFLNDDDLLAPQCVERLLDAFRLAPDVTLATSARQVIDADGAMLPDWPATRPITAESIVASGTSLANAMLLHGLNFLGEPSTALFRRDDMLAMAQPFGFAGVEGRGVFDMVLWASLLAQGNGVYLTERLSSLRAHAGQRQHQPDNQARTVDSVRALQARWAELGLHRQTPPDLMLTRPFSPQGDAAWSLQPVASLTQVAADPERWCERWRVACAASEGLPVLAAQ